MTRAELFGYLANITPVESTLLAAYENEEEKIWQKELGENPSKKGHTSFNFSKFPGDDLTVCGRAQVYNLLHPPSDKPLDPKTRALFDCGTVIEHMFVKRWANLGVLLSADVTGDDEFQTYFENKEVWLTGSPDAILLPPFYTKSHVCEVKSTSHEKVLAMREDPKNTIYSHSKYIRQLQAYISEANKKFSPTVITCEKSGLLIKNGEDRCASFHDGRCVPKVLKVEPPDDGTLFYSSREEPLLTASYYITKDDNIFEAGRARVKSWKEQFIEGILPEHVREGESSKWSIGECKYCEHKAPYCKIDHKNKVKSLKDSELINFSQKIRPSYNYQEARAAVFNRWGVKDPLREKVLA
jgi:hypothetical protein